MPLSVVTPPASEPISLAEAKTQLRVTGSDDDSIITPLLTAAREDIEALLRKALITQTLRLTLPEFPSVANCYLPSSPYASIILPRPPLVSVESVQYRDTNGDTQTLSTSLYVVVKGNPARIVLAHGQSWPDTQNHPEAVTVNFIAGHGSASDVPQRIKAAIYLQIEQLYEGPDENREKAIARLIDSQKLHTSAAWQHIN